MNRESEGRGGVRTSRDLLVAIVPPLGAAVIAEALGIRGLGILVAVFVVFVIALIVVLLMEYRGRHAPSTPTCTPDPSGAAVVTEWMVGAGERQRKLDIFTSLLTQAERLMKELEANGNDWSEKHQLVGWIQRCDDDIRREFGSPSDTLARSHGYRSAPDHLSMSELDCTDVPSALHG